MKTYTQKEINEAISKLNKALDIKLNDRKALNQDINSIKKNIKYYEDLDSSQYHI